MTKNEMREQIDNLERKLIERDKEIIKRMVENDNLEIQLARERDKNEKLVNIIESLQPNKAEKETLFECKRGEWCKGCAFHKKVYNMDLCLRAVACNKFVPKED